LTDIFCLKKTPEREQVNPIIPKEIDYSSREILRSDTRLT